MSLTKRVWIEKDPQYEDVRERFAQSAQAARAKFKHRVPLRRRGIEGQHWDPLWPFCIRKVVDELEVDSISVNASMFLKSEDDLRKVLRIARDMHEQLRQKQSRGCD